MNFQSIFKIGCTIALIVGLFSFTQKSTNVELKIVRAGFYEATQDSKRAKILSIVIQNFHSKSPVVKAYEGATLAIVAKTKWNPFVAIRLVKKASIMINAAVKKLPKNLEIRFVRFAVQKNIPSFLKLSENVEEDKSFIIEHIDKFDGSTLNKKLKNYILQFMIEQGGYNSEELDLIKKRLS